MRKIFTPAGKMLGLGMLLCALFVSNTARAIDWVEMSVPDEYEQSGYNFSFYFKVTPTSSGTLVISSKGTPGLIQYTDETAETEVAELGYVYGDGESKFSVTVTANETYYFKLVSYESDWTLSLSMVAENTAPTLTWQYPGEDEGYKLDINYYGYIAFKFDMDVTFDKVTLAAPDADDLSVEVTPYFVASTGYYNVTTKYILKDWLSYGLIEAGDKVTLTIEGLAAAGDGTKYNGDGTLVLEFIAPSVPTEVVGGDQDEDGVSLIAWPKTFYSWWDEGDTDGIVNIEFTQELLPMDNENQTACGTLGYGDKEDENGNYYQEDITDLISIDGKVLTVDFTGKDRTRLTMLPNAADEYDQVLVIVHLIRDIYGEYCYSSGSGSVASYQMFIPYEDIGGDPSEESTGIKAVTAAETATDVYYNVAGQRVATPTKGLYINGGKKVVVK
ncbi:MAG: hypothetical protein LUC26_01705 [Prevotella sp.]|nr:hypothetical protein [Prevotella sp.]